MEVWLKALLLLLAIKGGTYLFFPKIVRDFYAQHIVDAQMGGLKLFGGFLLGLAAVLWFVVLKEIIT